MAKMQKKFGTTAHYRTHLDALAGVFGEASVFGECQSMPSV
jgi:hypothetical protein